MRDCLNEIRAVLNCGNDKAIKLLAELDTKKGIGLIERIKQGQGKPAKIFVKDFSRQITPQDDNQTSTPNDEPSSSHPQDCGKSAAKSAENQQSRLPKNRSQDIGKSECNYIDMNYTYFSYINPSIYQRQSAMWTGRTNAHAKDTAIRKAAYVLNCPEQGELASKNRAGHRKADSGAFGVAVTASTAFGSTNANLLGDGP